MRKLALLAAAIPLFFSPGALAAETDQENRSVCPPPDVDFRYSAEKIIFIAVLPVEGCDSRQHRMFSLGAGIVRHGPNGEVDRAYASTPRGPYRSHGDDEPGDVCAIAVTLSHPEHERGVRYDFEANHNDAKDPQTYANSTVCSSNRKTAGCNKETL